MATFANFVSNSLVHENKRQDGTPFYNVSVPTSLSKTGFGSIAVNAKQVMQATINGVPSESYKNILLGNDEAMRTVSVATNKKGTRYKDIKMSNAEIKAAFDASKAAYRAAQKAEAEVEA